MEGTSKWFHNYATFLLIHCILIKDCTDGISCDNVCRSTLKLLFSQYKSYTSKNPNTSVPNLDPEQFFCLTNRISMFLSSINMVRSRVYQTLEGVAINEAERRHAFDSLTWFVGHCLAWHRVFFEDCSFLFCITPEIFIDCL